MDNRPAARVRTILNGRIIFNRGAASLDCVVRNLSASGAKLETTSTVIVPEKFDLLIARKNETRRARIVWRNEREIGVAFEKAGAGASPEETRIQALRDENGRLRRRVAELLAQSGEP